MENIPIQLQLDIDISLERQKTINPPVDFHQPAAFGING